MKRHLPLASLIDNPRLTALTLALVTAGAVVLVTIVLWRMLVVEEHRHLAYLAQERAKTLGRATEAELESRLRAMERMAGRWEMRGHIPYDEWRSDAERYVLDQPGQTVARINSMYRVRWVVPGEAKGGIAVEPLMNTPVARAAFRVAQATRETRLTGGLTHGDGRNVLMALTPMFVEGRFEGFLAAFLHVEVLFESLLAAEFGREYAVEVFDANAPIYAHALSTNDTVPPGRYAFSVRNLSLSIVVRPGLRANAGSFGLLGELALGGGLLLAVLLGALAYLARQSRQEVARRRLAEDQLRRHSEDLETLVVRRTEALADTNARLRAEIAERSHAEQELARSHQRLRELTAHLQAAREEERVHIARELHDELGQGLVGLGLELQWLRDKLPAGAAVLEERLELCLQLLKRTHDQMRNIVTMLRPDILDNLGLGAAVSWYVKQFQMRTGIDCRIDVSLDEGQPENQLATAVFRILQEALTNIARHSGAGRVWVRLAMQESALVLEVEDNGTGIGSGAMEKPKTFGLTIMKERAETFGGQLMIEAVHAGGARIRLVIPMIFVNLEARDEGEEVRQ